MSRLAALAFAFALAPSVALADAACSEWPDFHETLQRAQMRRQAYGWLTELAGSCWKKSGGAAVEFCFQFVQHDSVLQVEQRIEGRHASHFVMPPADLAIQASGDITLIAGGTLRRLAPSRFELVFRPHAAPVARSFFTRSPGRYGRCAHAER